MCVPCEEGGEQEQNKRPHKFSDMRGWLIGYGGLRVVDGRRTRNLVVAGILGIL